VLVLEAGPFLVPTHVQNLPNIGPERAGGHPAGERPGCQGARMGIAAARECQLRRRGVLRGRKVALLGGWCPRLLASDPADWLRRWPRTSTTTIGHSSSRQASRRGGQPRGAHQQRLPVLRAEADHLALEQLGAPRRTRTRARASRPRRQPECPFALAQAPHREASRRTIRPRGTTLDAAHTPLQREQALRVVLAVRPQPS
jgi:hypothetical protein